MFFRRRAERLDTNSSPASSGRRIRQRGHAPWLVDLSLHSGGWLAGDTTRDNVALAFVLTEQLVEVKIVGLARPQEVHWNVPACAPGVTREQLESIRQAGRIDPVLIGGPDFKPVFSPQPAAV
jgi:aryl-alcohol dehydrogenase-like predicted oxidoreductase